MGAELAPYIPRLLRTWRARHGADLHAAVEGTLVFADVSGFTRLSERLARQGGKRGAEQMTEVVDDLFGELLATAGLMGGQMLKYGGDAILLLFDGERHAPRAASAAAQMQARIQEIGRVDTGAGTVRLRMSVGVACGTIDLFAVGSSHCELVVAGPTATSVADLETSARPGEVIMSPDVAEQLAKRNRGRETDLGVRLRGCPDEAQQDVPTPQDDQDLAAFVPRSLRDHLTAEHRTNEHRLVTQAFVHVLGLDAALRRSPDEAAQALHETIVAIQDACDRYELSFLATDLASDGTKAILVAGAPRAIERPERRMLLALREVLDRDPPLAVRAGVNRGHVFTGDVGPEFRRTYTTIGDVTNTAARVMARAEPGELLTMASVTDQVSGEFVLTELEPFMAKGKREPLTPLRVEGAGLEPDSEGDRGARSPLVGRDNELDLLLGALRNAAEGRGRFVELIGETGHGKSRLVEELIDRSPEISVSVLRCEEYEQTTPYYPFRYLVRSALGLVDSPREKWIAQMRRAVPSELSPWLPLLGDVIDVDIDDTAQTRDLDAQYRAQRTSAVVQELLQQIFTEPTIIVFEDVHWVDHASAELLGRLETSVGSRPWLILTTSRGEPGFIGTGGSDTTVIELCPLGDNEVGELIARVAPRLPPPARQQVLEAAGGSPLFVESLLRHLAQETSGSEAQAERAGSLPDTLEEVVAIEIDALDPRARQLLELASVLGTAFSFRLFCDLVGDDVAPTTRRLAGATRGALTSRGDLVSFRHQLVREVVYERLPYRRRVELHTRASDLLEQRIEQGEDRFAVVSMHLWHAGRYELCWRHAREAAARAMEKHATVDAMNLSRLALDAAKRAGVTDDVALAEAGEDLAIAAVLAGDLDVARMALRDARRRAKEVPVLYARLCRQQARISDHDGKRHIARRWLRRGLTILETETSGEARRERAQLYAHYAWGRRDDGAPEDSLHYAQLALAEAEEARAPTIVALAYTIIDGALIALGRHDEAVHTRRALDLFDRAGGLAHKATVLNNLGAHAYYRGDWVEALELYEESLDGNRRVGNVLDSGHQSYNIAEILIDQGHLDRARALLDEVEVLWDSVGFDVGLLLLRALRGRLLLRCGDPHAAVTLLDAASQTFHDNGLAGHAAPIDITRAECHVALGELDEAGALLDALDPDSARDHAASVHRVRGLTALIEGDRPTALAALDKAVASAREAKDRYGLASALDLLATVTDDDAVKRSSAAERDDLFTHLGVVNPPSQLVP